LEKGLCPSAWRRVCVRALGEGSVSERLERVPD